MIRVVKVGGRVQSDPRLAAAIAGAWSAHPGELCLVHGGGDEMSSLQRRLGVEPRFSGGRRITEAADLELLRMTLSGAANKRLVSDLISAGVRAAGLSGEDAGILCASREASGTLGHVGAPRSVDASLLHTLLAAGVLPVLSPIARDAESGGAINVNGDDAAAAIAAALQADELLFVADVAAVLDRGVPVADLDQAQARTMIADGRAAGGMAAKLEAALAALAAGVPSVRIGALPALIDASHGTRLTAPQPLRRSA